MNKETISGNKIEECLAKAFRIVRRSRNVEFNISASQLRSDAVATEMDIQRTLGKKKFESICKKAFKNDQ